MVASTPTTGSVVGIVYSTVNKHMRQHIYVDSDAEWPAIQTNLQPGTSIAFVPMADHLAGHDTFHQSIATAIGVPTVAQLFTDPRCAVIDNVSLAVEQIILADAGIDILPGKTLINHQEVQVGHIYDPVLKQFTIPSFVLSAKSGVRPVDVVVPASTYSAVNVAV